MSTHVNHSLVDAKYTDICVCDGKSQQGVRQMELTAKQNVEVWSVCEKQYDFSCNHILIKKGDKATFPNTVAHKYSQDQKHLHIRERLSDPHTISTKMWTEIPLKSCTCAFE